MTVLSGTPGTRSATLGIFLLTPAATVAVLVARSLQAKPLFGVLLAAGDVPLRANWPVPGDGVTKTLETVSGRIGVPLVIFALYGGPGTAARRRRSEPCCRSAAVAGPGHHWKATSAARSPGRAGARHPAPALTCEPGRPARRQACQRPGGRRAGRADAVRPGADPRVAQRPGQAGSGRQPDGWRPARPAQPVSRPAGCGWRWNSATSFLQNAGRSSGLRLVTSTFGPCVQTWTSVSTQVPPAFWMSVRRLGQEVSVRPRAPDPPRQASTARGR